MVCVRRRSMFLGGLVFSALLAPGALPRAESTYDVREKSVAELQRDLTSGDITSEALVAAYLRRIETLDRAGPRLQSVISVNPAAMSLARQLDAERAAGRIRSSLHGIPVMLKDNIESADSMATTAGTPALLKNFAARDSAVAARLREAGAIILAKTNLGNWSEIQSMHAIGGWSALGGLVRNPYVLDRTACGSSAGSGAAVAASLTAIAVGTETDNSIICPSSVAGLVALKPTVGLISRAGLIPISRQQDSAGPMARNVADLAVLLEVLAGSDAADDASAAADAHRTEYSKALTHGDLHGRRLGVLRFATGRLPQVDASFDTALAVLRGLGAEVIDIRDYQPPERLRADELTVMLAEFKANIDAYLRRAPASVRVRSLAEVIEFNRNSPRDLALFGQDLLEAADASSGVSEAGHIALGKSIRRAAGANGIDKLLAKHRLDALIAPSGAPAGRIDAVRGAHPSLGVSNLPAIAGYPHLTVPMGFVSALPVGLSFIGPAWSEASLLQMAAVFERATQVRREPAYLPSIEASAALGDLLTRDGEADAVEGSPRSSSLQPGQSFQDCAGCPRMVVIPPGSFVMGSTAHEQDVSVSQGRARKYTDRENPQHTVTIAKPFAIGVFEVTREQFAAFVRDTARRIEPGCQTFEPTDTGFKRTPRTDRGWQNPGYPQDGNHPVTCLTWDDAHAYAQWLGEKTGKPYRLISEAEWEYVARAGTTTYRYWGDDSSETDACAFANVADLTPTPFGKPWQPSSVFQCSDGYWASAPVGSFKSNAFGVHDILGNVWEWLADCANENYSGAPNDGSTWTTGDCARRALRGGGFHENGPYTRIAIRGFNTTASRYNTDGFRVARDLQP